VLHGHAEALFGHVGALQDAVTSPLQHLLVFMSKLLVSVAAQDHKLFARGD